MVMDSSKIGRGRKALQRDSGGGARVVSANIPIPNLAYVETSSPDANFSAGPFYWMSHSDIRKQILIGRFSQQLNGDASGILFPASFITASVGRNGPINNIGGPFIRGEYKLYEITDDFDITTITYNIYTGLTTNQVVNLPFEFGHTSGSNIDILGSFITLSTLHGQRGGLPPNVDHHILGFNKKENNIAINFSGAYGLAVEVDAFLRNRLDSFSVACRHQSVEIGAISASTIDRRPYITSQGLVGTNYNPL